MRTALVGHTGFVGTSLRAQTTFTDHFNSANVERLPEATYDLVVCAGAPAAKWKANTEPAADRANLARLTGALAGTEAHALLLVSTVDVYPDPDGVDEETPIDPDDGQPYGRHRRALEIACLEAFPKATVVRLPALFGTGLRKNFVYDLLHQPDERFTHHASVFQFYDMRNLWRDLRLAADSPHRVHNLVTEPLTAGEVARVAFDVDYDHVTTSPPVRYDVRTRFAATFGGQGPYVASRDTVLADLRAFAAAERGAPGS